MATTTETDDASARRERGDATRARIMAATVSCLDALGYAETSIARVQEAAGVSRGALTHHFPSRQSLLAETAMNLLGAALAPTGRWRADDAAPPTATLLKSAWTRVADTPEGRAFL